MLTERFWLSWNLVCVCVTAKVLFILTKLRHCASARLKAVKSSVQAWTRLFLLCIYVLLW